MSAIINKSRYPGIRAFEKNERHVFFGRRIESKKLYNLIKAKPLAVLFAKSGIGKSSLINAGVEPLLEKDYFQVIKIRLQTTSISSVEMVKNELKPFLDEERLKTHTKGEPGLWEYLRACDFNRNGEKLTPVLIFDQFEEFFEHSKSDQEELNQELADMVSNRLPERIRASLRAISFRDRSQDQLDWHSPIPVKFIFAIRSDRMSLMDEMSIKIPSILHHRFHLKPLDIAAAKEAIIEPAALKEEGFDTPPFTYDPVALETILDYLKNKNDEIESFQLQLLCQNIERKVLNKKANDLVVQEADFGGAFGIKSILNNYYEQEINELEEAERPLARTFIEEGLIVGGRRVGISEGVEEKTYGIDKDLLSKLLASRLIRAENTHLGRSFELSHDTLVDPILQSYKVRQREEDKQKLIAQQKEQELLLAAERKKRRRAMLLAITGFVLFAIAAMGGFYAAKQSEKAKKAQREAERLKEVAFTQRDKAREAKRKAEVAQLKIAENNLETGLVNLEFGRYDAARENFKTVLSLQSVIDTTIIKRSTDSLFARANELMIETNEKSGSKKRFDFYVKGGDRAFRNKKYTNAIKEYKSAYSYAANSNDKNELKQKITAITIELKPLYIDALDKAETFLETGSDLGKTRAKEQLQKAERIRRVIGTDLSSEDIRRLNQLKRNNQ